MCFIQDLFALYFLVFTYIILYEEKFYFPKIKFNWSGKYAEWSLTLRKVGFLKKLFMVKDFKKRGVSKFWPVFRRESVQFLLWQYHRAWLWWSYWCSIEASWYEQDHDAKLRRHVYERDARRFIEMA